MMLSMRQGRSSPASPPIVGALDEARKRAAVYLATAMPGLGRLLVDEIERHPRLRVTVGPCNDGRSDVVGFQAVRGTDPLELLRLAEDVFVLVGVKVADADAQRLASGLITREGLERALSVRSRLVAAVRSEMTYRVITRVLSEQYFRRTSLRSVVYAAVARHRPRWTVADPSALELWVQQLTGDTFVAALRLSDPSMRRRRGRAIERHGALRPAVAAAMVSLAGAPVGRLLDPFCGTGTILAEAAAVGWTAEGRDIDHDAVVMARANVPSASVAHGDARELPHGDGTVDAVVSNLPFGRQYEVDARVLEAALLEMDRVTAPTGTIVLLHPPPLPSVPAGRVVREEHELELLGVTTSIWVLERPS
jgi:23S rRNA G2445 N2-methylase RlmL